MNESRVLLSIDFSEIVIKSFEIKNSLIYENFFVGVLLGVGVLLKSHIKYYPCLIFKSKIIILYPTIKNVYEWIFVPYSWQYSLLKEAWISQTDLI